MTVTIFNEGLKLDLTAKEVAEQLQIGYRTVIRLIHRGKFPNAYKENPFATTRSEWRIPEEDIAAFEKARKELK